MEIEEYTLLNCIGKGMYASVYLGLKRGSSIKYAVKKIEKEMYLKNSKAFKYLENEISILKDVNHPNIIKLIDVKETLKDVYIITEYCNGGNLEECLDKYLENNNEAFSEEIVQNIMRQIIEAMKYLHNKHIMHRHICLSNILLNYEDENDRKNNNIMKGKIKIIDFGYSRYLKKGELAKSIVGSPFYMSPIILNKLNKFKDYKKTEYDEKEDIWSLGIVCYILLIGKSPFDSESMAELAGQLDKGNYTVPITLSKEAISFLNCMLQYDPGNRLKIDELYNHNFLRKNQKIHSHSKIILFYN